MLELLGAMVVVLLVGPLVVIAGAGVLLLLTAVCPGGPYRARTRFRCPWTRRVVRAEFLMRAGAAHPSDVGACTAFRNPERITCTKPCRELADVRWTAPRGIFPGWALTAGGPVMWEEARTPVAG